MIEIKVKNQKNEILEIRPLNGYLLYDAEGLAEIKSDINSNSIVNGDGTIITNVRAQERNIVLYIKLLGDIEDSRLRLRKYFPIKSTVTLYLKTNYRDVYITGTVESNSCTPFTENEVAQISLICPDPWFYDVDDSNTFFSGTVPNFEFPFAIAATGKEFSYLVYDVIKTIYYDGEADTGFILELFAIGAVSNPVIYNTQTRGSFAINTDMIKGDLITIDTRPGNKGITLTRNGVVTNIINLVQRPTEWFKLSPGDNIYTYDCESGLTSLQLTLKHNNAYEGI